MNKAWKIAGLAALIVAAAGCAALDLLAGPGPCGPALNVNSLRWSDDGQTITFVAEDPSGDSGVIEAVNRDGSGLRQLAAAGGRGDWSPDGKRLVYAQGPGVDDQIYVINADGTGKIALTHTPGPDLSPVWSPDPGGDRSGKRIAFASYRDDEYTDIYVIDLGSSGSADGAKETRLTHTPGQDWFPDWSPDGKRIAFESERDGDFEIYVMNADGSNQTRLTTTPGSDFYPVWSPDGERIAFVSQRDQREEIYVMDADGSHQTRLTDLRSSYYRPPVWSPDPGGTGSGTRIVFSADPDGRKELYVVNADGSGFARLTHSNGDDNFPVWSPDGKSIAFVSVRSGAPEVFVMDLDSPHSADGSNKPGEAGLTRLTHNPAVQRCRR